jgi:hypothetical protein
MAGSDSKNSLSVEKSWGGGHVLIEAAMFWLANCMGHHDACGGAEA